MINHFVFLLFTRRFVEGMNTINADVSIAGVFQNSDSGDAISVELLFELCP